MNPKMQAHFCFHDSVQPLQNLRNLAEYGIPPDCVPVELGGNLKFDYQDWLHDIIVEDLLDADALPDKLKHICKQLAQLNKMR